MTRTEPTAIGGMTQEELDKELRKGIESIKEGKTFTADEVDEELAREFGILHEKQLIAVSFFRLENCIYMQKSIVKEENISN